MSDPVSVIVPARDEAATIRKVVETLLGMDSVTEVIVVDNGSSDDTGRIALAAGARVVAESTPGMGHAAKAGFAAASHNWVMKVDADLDKFDTRLFARMSEARTSGVGLVKGAWNDPKDNMPMTRLLVMPAIRQMFPYLGKLRAPNSGIYLFDQSLIAIEEMTGDYAVDLDVMLRVHASGAEVVEVDIGRIVHDSRDIQHYNNMAEIIMGFFLEQHEKQILKETVVLAQTAEQVICNSLGVLAARSKYGAVVTVFLAQYDTDSARVLSNALSPFPTASVQSLDKAGGFKPRHVPADLRVIASYPVVNEEGPINEALRIAQAFGRPEHDLFLMPNRPERVVVDGFKADMAIETGSGSRIKAQMLEKIAAEIGAASKEQSPRELFQSYQSLPDALKSQLLPASNCADAGNM
ncbi:Glucosyl-3-phosphoglycerate synthase [Roseovarius litorisediminis]|uniref:Glucosyl-3-phosphoglycerate synthase n=1 Tax=Roseovarius litorisediminis TaxID=1312363 RepID=A0A1Y5SSZ8_9RHOB|nr:glycosyltransferase [Roseovarius litorisediminis]SLN47853.1 Glucosyl-3-phosphoglycerate synthase [Roseovarius litorisediminis]